MYVPRDGFTLIVSEERIWSSDDRGEQNRESVRTDYIRVLVIRGDSFTKKLACLPHFSAVKKLFWYVLRRQNTIQKPLISHVDLPQVDCESEGRRDEVASRESTCSACGILNLICILLARKNWV